MHVGAPFSYQSSGELELPSQGGRPASPHLPQPHSVEAPPPPPRSSGGGSALDRLFADDGEDVEEEAVDGKAAATAAPIGGNNTAASSYDSTDARSPEKQPLKAPPAAGVGGVAAPGPTAATAGTQAQPSHVAAVIQAPTPTALSPTSAAAAKSRGVATAAAVVPLDLRQRRRVPRLGGRPAARSKGVPSLNAAVVAEVMRWKPTGTGTGTETVEAATATAIPSAPLDGQPPVTTVPERRQPAAPAPRPPAGSGGLAAKASASGPSGTPQAPRTEAGTSEGPSASERAELIAKAGEAVPGASEVQVEAALVAAGWRVEPVRICADATFPSAGCSQRWMLRANASLRP